MFSDGGNEILVPSAHHYLRNLELFAYVLNDNNHVYLGVVVMTSWVNACEVFRTLSQIGITIVYPTGMSLIILGQWKCPHLRQRLRRTTLVFCPLFQCMENEESSRAQ